MEKSHTINIVIILGAVLTIYIVGYVVLRNLDVFELAAIPWNDKRGEGFIEILYSPMIQLFGR